MSTVNIFPDRFGYRQKANEIRAHMIMLRTEQAVASGRVDWMLESAVFALCTAMRSVRATTTIPTKFKCGGRRIANQLRQ